MVLCRSIISDVDEVTFSDGGKIATVKEVLKDPKRRLDGDAEILPIAYVAEIRSMGGKLIARQRFARKSEELELRLLISPAGKEVALVRHEWSQAAQHRWSGSIIDLDPGK
jgi:hypothetical protein